MKSRGKQLLSLILTICILPMVSLTALADYDYDSTKQMTVTVTTSESSGQCLDECKDYGYIVYDLYKVDAPAGLDENFNFSDYAQELLPEYVKNDATAKDESKLSYKGIALGSKTEVEPGFYLLVARCQSIIANQSETAVTTVTKLEADGVSGSRQLATYTRLGAHFFTIAPQIIAVPTKVDENGNILKDTLQPGTWKYDQTITLKMLDDPESGSIRIDKRLTGFHEGEQNATFVFKVETFFPNEDTLFDSEYYSMVFTEAGEKSITVNGLPVGSIVKVYEVYSGANYVSNIQYPNSLNLVVDVAADKNSVAFINDYNGGNKGGGGLVNHFTYVEDESNPGNLIWSWTQLANGNVESTNGRVQKYISDLLNEANN